MSARRYRSFLGVLTAVGLGIRLAWTSWVSREPASIFFDPARYHGLAIQISSGKGMTEVWNGDPTAYYPPGYPWFLGTVAWLAKPLTSDIWLVAGITQAFLGAASVVLIAYVARKLAGPLAGLVAAGIYALYPNLIFHSGVMLGETLYIFFFLAFLAAVLSRPWNADFGLPRVFGSGVLLGLAVMVRPISLAVIPVVALVWLLARKDWSSALRWSAALCAGVALCVLPWTIRNAVRLDAFVPISTNTGDNLCMGHAEGATGAFNILSACDVPFPFEDGVESELASDKAKQRIARESFIENIDREPWLLWRRVYFTWVRDGDHDGLFAATSYRDDPWMDFGTEARLIWIADRVYWVVVAAGLVGLVQMTRRRRPEDLLLVGAAIMTAAVPLAFFGDQRFKVPVIPLLIVAAATLVRQWSWEPGDPPDRPNRAEVS